MASPQKENGFSPLANEILEAVYKTKFNGTQLSILLCVWRYTYGFSRKKHELSVSFLCESTGITKRQVQRELGNLIDGNVLIEVRAASFNQTRIIAFNKNYDMWRFDARCQINRQVTKSVGGDELDTSPGDELDTSPGDELDTQERNNKEKYKEKVVVYDDVEKLMQENGFGLTVSPLISKSILDWSEKFDDGFMVVCEAVKQSVFQNKRKWNYVNGILSKWHKSGLKKIDDVIDSIETFEQFKNINVRKTKTLNEEDFDLSE